MGTSGAGKGNLDDCACYRAYSRCSFLCRRPPISTLKPHMNLFFWLLLLKAKQPWYGLCVLCFILMYLFTTLTIQRPPFLLQMDVIAGYKTGGSIVGDILIDGFRKDERVWKKISGYAEQVSLATDRIWQYLAS
jgi:hypothetical protein